MIKPFLSVGTLINRTPIEDQFYIAKEAGFHGIDYILTIQDLFQTNNKVHELSKRFAIPVKGIHIPLPLIPYCPPIFFKKLHKKLSEFHECEVFNVHLSSFVTPFDKTGRNLEKFFKEFSDRKYVITFESNPRTKLLPIYPSATVAPDLFARFCIENNLPINLDVSHVSTFTYDIRDFYNNYKDSIKLIHLSDFNGKTQHLPFGKGTLPLTVFFKMLKETHYTGHVIFEILFPHQYPISQKLEEMKDSLEKFIDGTK